MAILKRNPLRIAVNGALGRMGARIVSLAESDAVRFKIAGLFDASAKTKGVEALVAPARLRACDVLIDFSSPEGARACLRAAFSSRTALVIGTTGLGSAMNSEIEAASRRIPVVFSPNMSLGANFLFDLAALSARSLRSGYDIEVIEKHHRLKKDAPSGTAKKIAEVIAKEKGWELSRALRCGREGVTGERGTDEIGVHAIRGGDIVGEHSVLFCGPGEILELKHTALSRDAFARGALEAALFLRGRSKGLYSMRDVIKSDT